MSAAPRVTVLAIAPVSNGFGYAVFEDILIPVDWAVKNVREKPLNRNALKQARALINTFHPDVILLEDYSGEDSYRCERIQNLIDSITKLALKQEIVVHHYSRGDIRKCFSAYDAKTKDDIARVIARELPEFAPRLPPERKIWKSIDYRMAIFDAVALVFTYYSNQNSMTTS